MLQCTGDQVQHIPTSNHLTFTTTGTTRTTTEHDCGTTLATQGENSHATNNIIAGTDGRILKMLSVMVATIMDITKATVLRPLTQGNLHRHT